MNAELSQILPVAGQVAMGVGLAACAGLRAFLPLFAVGLAGRFDWLPLTGSFEWLESWPALTVFGVAVVAELLGDKFPVVDHALDSVGVFVKPVAGVALTACVLTELTPLQATVLGVVGGGTASAAVLITKANLRAVSTATTGGLANPVISIVEDVGAVAGTAASLVLPTIAVFAVG